MLWMQRRSLGSLWMPCRIFSFYQTVCNNMENCATVASVPLCLCETKLYLKSSFFSLLLLYITGHWPTKPEKCCQILRTILQYQTDSSKHKGGKKNSRAGWQKLCEKGKWVKKKKSGMWFCQVWLQMELKPIKNCCGTVWLMTPWCP